MFENSNLGAPKQPKVTQEDIASAEALIAETPVLAGNPRVQALAENGFVSEDGRQLDPGNFLSAMLDFISTNQEATGQALGEAIERNMVAHSVAPEEEPRAELN